MSDTFKTYRGKYRSKELVGEGTTKEGKSWRKYKLGFQHNNEFTYPIKFSWWEPNKQNLNLNNLDENQTYKVVYVLEEFVNKEGQSVQAKKAVKIEKSDGLELGFNTDQSPTSTKPASDVVVDEEKMCNQYRENVSAADWNPYHFIVWFTLNTAPTKEICDGLQKEYEHLKKLYQDKVVATTSTEVKNV